MNLEFYKALRDQIHVVVNAAVMGLLKKGTTF